MKIIKRHFTYFMISMSFLMAPLLTYSQDTDDKSGSEVVRTNIFQDEGGRPDIPGDLMIEFGYNWVQEHSEGVGFNTLGSRTFNAYYLFEYNVGESAFSIHPGFGIGTEKYKFANNLTLGYSENDTLPGTIEYVQLDSIFGTGTSYRKSQINPVYFDIPLEIRWRAKKYDPKRSFKVTLGGKVGFLIDAKTKVKYNNEGETKVAKSKQNFEMNPIRYGAYMRVGFGGFSAYGYYSLSDLFRKDKGPDSTTMYPITFGLSLALF
jgi:hypothetical protein